MLTAPETEDSWEKISNALLRLTAMCNGGACDYPQTFVPALRSLSRPVTSAAASERSRLSASATEFIATVASGLGADFEPLVSHYFPTLVSLCSRPNKVFVSRAKTAIHTIIEQTQLPVVLQYLVEGLKDKSAIMRLIAIEGILACLNSLNPPDLERESRAREIEAAIRTTATDASGDVRKVSRQVFDAYKILLPNRVDRCVGDLFFTALIFIINSFTAPMTPTMKKYLNVKATAPSSAANSRPPSQQSTRSTSRPASATGASRHIAEVPVRPATSLSHARSASASYVAANSLNASSSSQTAKPVSLSRSMTELARPHAENRPARRNDMPPPAVVPQRRVQVASRVDATSATSSDTNNTTAATAPIVQRANSRTEVQRILRGPTSVKEPERPPSAAVPGPAPARPVYAPMRGEAAQFMPKSVPMRPPTGQQLTTKEKLMGVVGARRVLMPEPQSRAEQEEEEEGAEEEKEEQVEQEEKEEKEVKEKKGKEKVGEGRTKTETVTGPTVR